MHRLMVVLALVLAPGAAHGWQQATTDAGLALYQEERCLFWTLSGSGSQDVEDLDALRQAVARGFDVWNQPECSSLSITDAGLSSCTAPDISPRGTQASLVVFYETGWPYESPLGNPFAATGLWYDPDTGEILDADMSLNGFEYTWSLDGAEGTVDVQSIVAHEAGHVLGLGESTVPDATMYGFAVTGETSKRDLHEDDVEGLCTLYPADGEDRPCPDPPAAAALCAGDTGCGCTLAPGAKTPQALAALLALLVLVHLALANRRGDPRPRR